MRVRQLLIWLVGLTAAWSLPGARLHAQLLDFTTIVNWDNAHNCGAPGQPGCFTGCAKSAGIKIRIDPYTAQSNCDLPAPTCTTGLAEFPLNPNDITFLVASDLHLRNGWNILDANHVRHVAFMNSIPQLNWTWDQIKSGIPSDPVGNPLALVTTGDDTHYGHQDQLGAFRLLYEMGQSTTALHYPLFPGLGNHDLDGDCGFNNCASRMFDYAAKAAGCGLSVDPASHSYSWDWGDYHLIQLHKWVGDTSEGNGHTHPAGIAWLALDLATRVGTSGKKVIIFQHYGWDPFSIGKRDPSNPPWWTDADRASFLSLIRNYNVAAVFSGHSHAPGMYSASITDSQGNTKTIDNFTGGTGGQSGHGQFFVVRLTKQFMDVGNVEWDDGDSTIAPNPTTFGNGDTSEQYRQPHFKNEGAGCRKWVGPAPQTVPVTLAANGHSVTYTNNSGLMLKGPLALEIEMSQYADQPGYMFGIPGAQIIASASCSQGPVYAILDKTQLGAGETGTLNFSSSNFYAFTRMVSLGNDALAPSPTTVTVAPGGVATVDVRTLFGRRIPVAVSSSGWVKASLDSSTTPTTLRIGVDVSQSLSQHFAKLLLSSTDPAYPDQVAIEVNLAPVQLTVSSSDGEPLNVNGNTVQSPYTFSSFPGDTVNLSAPDFTLPQGVSYRFNSWSDGLPRDHKFPTPLSDTTYRAQFDKYLNVTTSSNPAGTGTVMLTPSSPDGYYKYNSAIQASATANQGYLFSLFNGYAAGQSTLNLNVTTPLSLDATFVAQGNYVISTSLGVSGSVTVDQVTTAGSATVQWASGSSHSVSVPVQVNPSAGTRYQFVQWSDGVTTPSRTIVAGNTSTYVAQYQLQFLLTANVSPATGGIVSGSGWYNDQAPAILLASPGSGFSFGGFSGDFSGTQNPATVTVVKPMSIAANFTPGTPAVYASAGPRSNLDTNTTQLTIVLANSGAGAASGLQIDSIATKIQVGSGAVVATGLPAVVGTLAPGQSTSALVTLNWPSTATRVSLTVNYTANGGAYRGQSTFYVLR